MAERQTFVPKATLRETPLKRALKSYLIPIVLSKYVVFGLRVLWKDNITDFNDFYVKRKKLEEQLDKTKEVVFFINCITAMKGSGDSTKVGFAFWIAVDYAESQIMKFETYISKLFLEAGVEVPQVNSIRGRGKNFFKFLITCYYMLLHAITPYYTF